MEKGHKIQLRQKLLGCDCAILSENIIASTLRPFSVNIIDKEW